MEHDVAKPWKGFVWLIAAIGVAALFGLGIQPIALFQIKIPSQYYPKRSGKSLKTRVRKLVKDMPFQPRLLTRSHICK